MAQESLRELIPPIITQVLTKNFKLGSSIQQETWQVEDTTDAFLSTLNKKDIGEIINIGSYFEISIKELFPQFSI